MKAKVLTAITLTSLLFLGLTPKKTYAQEDNNQISLKDVPESHWAYESLKTLIEKYDLKLGYPDGTYRGDRNLTRYEVAALLVQVLESLEKSHMSKGKNALSKSDIKTLKKLGKEFSGELEEVEDNISQKLQLIEDHVDMIDIENQKQDMIIEKLINDLPVVFSGNIGFRYQLSTEKFGDFSNSIPQSRVSFGINSKGLENFDLGARVITNPKNKITNTWWRFGDFFSRFEMNLDRFFVTYKPGNLFELTLGKFQNPFVNTELLFDEEISPQGAIQKFKLFNSQTSALREFSVTLGEIIVSMEPTFGNSYLLSGNADLKLNLTDFIGININGGYHHYLGEDNIAKANKIAMDNNQEPRIIGNSNTNSLEQDGSYSANFNIVNGFGKIIFRLHENFPLSISGEYLYNLGSVTDNQAFQIGAKVGHLNNPGNFTFGYNFKHLQKDANISLFVEDQLGKTDVQGHEVLFGVKLFPKTILSATLQTLNSIKTNDTTTYLFRTNLMQSF